MASRPPKVWITYAWADNTTGDFDHLVQDLQSVGVEAVYDRVQIVPGRRLWEQIAAHILDGAIDGWAYLLTGNSVASQPCREELAYALYRALSDRGANFPLIGLLHQVGFDVVPASLKVRLCVNLGSPNWKQEIKAGLLGTAPPSAGAALTKYHWTFTKGIPGNPLAVRIEVRPRFGELFYWRIAVPLTATVLEWGHGPAGGGAIFFNRTSVVENGTGDIGGVPCTWFGAGDGLSPGVSAYVTLGSIPPFVGFGTATGPIASPDPMEIYQL